MTDCAVATTVADCTFASTTSARIDMTGCSGATTAADCTIASTTPARLLPLHLQGRPD